MVSYTAPRGTSQQVLQKHILSSDKNAHIARCCNPYEPAIRQHSAIMNINARMKMAVT
jgi:hypothetical protein